MPRQSIEFGTEEARRFLLVQATLRVADMPTTPPALDRCLCLPCRGNEVVFMDEVWSIHAPARHHSDYRELAKALGHTVYALTPVGSRTLTRTWKPDHHVRVLLTPAQWLKWSLFIELSDD